MWWALQSNENVDEWLSRQVGEEQSTGCIRTTDLLYHHKASLLKLLFFVLCPLQFTFNIIYINSRNAKFGSSLVVSHKVNIVLPYNPSFLLLGIYPNDLKPYTYIKTYTCILFTAALVIIAKI